MANENLNATINIKANANVSQADKELNKLTSDIRTGIKNITSISGDDLIDTSKIKQNSSLVIDEYTKIQFAIEKLKSQASLNNDLIGLDNIKEIEKICGDIFKNIYGQLQEAIINTNSAINTSANNINELNEAVSASSDSANHMSDVWDEVFEYLSSGESAFDNINTSVEDSYNDFNNLNNVDLSSLLNQVASLAGVNLNASSSITNLAQSLGGGAGLLASIAGAVAAFGILEKTFQILIKNVEKCEESLKELAKVGSDVGKTLVNALANIEFNMLAGSVDLAINSFDLLINTIDSVIQKLDDYNELTIDVYKDTFKLINYIGKDGTSKIYEYANSLNSLISLDVEGYASGISKLIKITQNLGDTSTSVDKLTKALGNFALDLSAISGEDFDSIGTKLENAISRGTLGNGANSLASLINLTKEEKEQFKQLGTEAERVNFILSKGKSIQGAYAKWMETPIGKIEQFNNQISTLRTNIAKFASNMFAYVAPVLVTILKLINQCIVALAKFFNIDLSDPVSSFEGLGDTAGDASKGLEKTADSINDVGDAAKKNERKVASFDDVIQLTDSGSEGLNNTDNYDIDDSILSDWSTLGYEVESVDDNILDLKQKIKDLLEQFKNWEEAIDWDSLREKAREYGKELADILNIIVEDEQAWKDFGNLVGNGLNVALELLNAFAKEFNFKQLGKSIGAGINEFWNALDKDLLVETVINWLKGAFATIEGLVESGAISNSIQSIFEIIGKLFAHFSTLDGVVDANTFKDTISSFIQELLKGINNGISELNKDDVILGFTTFFRAIIDGVTENVPELIETLSGITATLIRYIGIMISETLDSLFTNMSEEDIDSITDSIISVINSIFSAVGNIGDSIDTDKIYALISSLLDKIIENMPDYAAKVKKLIDPLIKLATNLLKEYIENGKLRNSISEFLNNSGIYDLVATWIRAKFAMWFQELQYKLLNAGQMTTKVIGQVLASIGTTIGSFLKDAFEVWLQMELAWLEFTILPFYKIYEVVKNLITMLVESFKPNLELIIQSFEETGETIGNWLTEKINGIIEFIQSAGDSIMNIFKSVGDFLGNVFESFRKNAELAINAVKGFFEGLFDKLTEIWEKITGLPEKIGSKFSGLFGGFNFSMPHLATGGIVNKETLVTIGESGREAVIPLDNNTDWMDELATRINVQNNQNSSNSRSNGNVTISFKDVNPGFYTRNDLMAFGETIIKSLQLYNVNVSAV